MSFWPTMRRAPVWCAAVLASTAGARAPALLAPADPAALARTYAEAVEALNEAHARKPAGDEAQIAERLPRAAGRALDELLAAKPGEGLAEALRRCGEAALDLARIEDFERVRARLAQVLPGEERALGLALARPRFLARGLDGVEPEGLAAVADAFDEVLDSYQRVFGFREWNKVPGKRLRLRVHLVERITSPPHFAPQFPWHSEIDFPVVDPRGFASPTAQGQFLLYGLAHELGHVIAMWGDRSQEQDHHAWAHYTGVTVVEELARERADAPAMKALRDVRWRSLELERARLAKEGIRPGTADRDGVLALLVALHDLVGPASIGAALNALDAKGGGLRVNRVRYWQMEDLWRALAATPAGKQRSKELGALLR